MKTILARISLISFSLIMMSNCSKTDETAAGGTTVSQFDEDASCVASPPTPTSATSALANNSTLTGKQSASVLLGTGNTYYLSGVVNFACGTELKIQSGVTIKAITTSTSGLVIQRGARIDAQGTTAAPIKMTSNAAAPAPGDWGGLTIQGRSVWNQAGNEATTEFDTGKFGLAAGAVTTDNSGTLKYVIIEFAGKKLTTTKEWNNLSLYAVGSNTTIDHINLSRGSDDGIEFFGGTVNVSYLISFANGDDMIDWTNGWTGKVQYAIAYLGNNNSYRDPDQNLLEGDNDQTSNDLLPRSNPTLANISFATDGACTSATSLPVASAKTLYKGVFMIRRGTYLSLYNSVVQDTNGMKIQFVDESTVNQVGTGVISKGTFFGRIRTIACGATDSGASQMLGTALSTFVDGGTAYAVSGATTNPNEALFVDATNGSAAADTACLPGSSGFTSALTIAGLSAIPTNLAAAFTASGTCTGATGQTLPVVTGLTADTGIGAFTAAATGGTGALGWNIGAWMTISTTGL